MLQKYNLSVDPSTTNVVGRATTWVLKSPAMKTLADRVWQRMRQLGLSQDDVAERAGMSQPAVSKICKGQSKRTRFLLELAAALECRPEWLKDGKGDVEVFPPPPGSDLDTPLPSEQRFPRTPHENDYALVPQYSVKGACGDGHMNDHVEVKGGLAFKRDWLATLGVKPEDAVVIYASGDSMAPTIQDGAVILIDCSQREVRPGKTYAFLAGEDVRIKRVFQSLSGVWRLASDNPDKARYPDEEIHNPYELSVIGRCVWQGGAL